MAEGEKLKKFLPFAYFGEAVEATESEAHRRSFSISVQWLFICKENHSEE
jgi:hypothetical protein